jgi:hypothetical protein
MNWAWPASLDDVWRLPAFPMWLTLAAAGLFGILLLITLLRAEKSVASGALTVITLLAVGIAAAATLRGPLSRNMSDESRSFRPMSDTAPAMSCPDDLAGDAVLTACEKVLFGSAESVAAAVSHTASQLNRLMALGDVATADQRKTPELEALRRTLEHDRYGLVAQVLVARDHCTPTECAAFRSLTDSRQILVNMDNRLYDVLVARYAPSWNAPPPPVPVAALGPSVPTGRPTNADFPSSSSIPPISIMTPEPGTGSKASEQQHATTPAANAQAATPRPPQEPKPVPSAVKKQAAQKQAPRPPTSISPTPTPISPTPPPPAASND